MTEYINRKEALHKISINALSPIAEVYKAVEVVPVADVQPVVHGKWDDSKVAFHLMCSKCRCVIEAPKFYEIFLDYHGELNFCPNCGARMDGEA